MMSAAPAQQKATGSEIAREALDRIGALMAGPASILEAAMRLTGRGDLADKLLGSLEVDTSHVARALGYTPQRSADKELGRMVAGISNAPTRKV